MTTREISSPILSPNKRLKLENESSSDDESVEGPARPDDLEITPDPSTVNNQVDEDSDTEENCVICLQVIVDRTVIPTCLHDRFCFECLELWTAKSRKCPLCTSAVGAYIIHNVRSRYDFQKYFLPPLRSSSPAPLQPLRRSEDGARRSARRTSEVAWGRRGQEAQDALERAVEKRKWVYRHNLYAKHVASNRYTKYKPYPSPSQFASSPDLISKATAFIRRELRVWPNLDVEFLMTFIISLMKSIDIRHESAVKLLSEFLDVGMPYSEVGRKVNAEHFAHELYSYLRSPFRELNVYDANVQYDTPNDTPSPSASRTTHDRWIPSRRSPSVSPSAQARGSVYQPESPIDFSPRDGDFSVSPLRRRRSRSRSMSSDRDIRRCEDYRREYAPHDRTSRDRKGKARATDYRDGSVRGGGSRRSGFGSRHDSESRRERSSTSRRPSPSLGSPRRRGTEIEASEVKNSATSAFNEPSTRREVQEQSEMDPPAVIDLITVGSSDSSRMQVDPSPDNQSETLPLEGSSKQLAGGISIKGASLTATKSSGGLTIKGRATVKAENSNPDALEANHGPSLLARMSDPHAITQEISERLGQRPTPSPTISEAMDETRAELIARRKGEVREIGRTQRLDATGSGLNVSPLIEDDQQRQLLQKLEAEKLTQLNAANDSSSDSQSQKEAQLRTQLRLRLRLAAEKRRTDEMETPQQ